MRAGWEIKRLGDICGFQNGFAFKSNLFKANGYPILRISNIQDEVIETRRVVYFQPEDYKENFDRYRVFKGDLLIAMSGATTGKIGFNTTEQLYFLNQRVGKFEPKGCLLKKYLFYFLSTRVADNLRIAAGAAQPNLSTEQIKDFEIPIPPLPEQQRIVALLDEAFAAIATAKANAEKNLNNARALFDSYLNAVFARRGDGWVENKLVSLTSKIGSGATPRGGGESYKTEGTSLIRSLNVHDPGFRYSKLAFLDDGQADGLSNVIVQPGDVLLNITGASVARCCIVPDDVLPARVNQHVSIIRPISSKLDSDFLHYLLISKYYKDQLLQTGAEGGATRQAITKAQIQDFSVGYPADKGEQQSIVSKLDALRKETQHLESIYQKKIEALDVLKKSILHQAFNGEL